MTRYEDLDVPGGGLSRSGPGWTAGPDRLDSADFRAYRTNRGRRAEQHGGGGAGPAGGYRRGGASGPQPRRRSRFLRPSRHAVLGGAAIIAMFAVVTTSLVAYAQYRGVLSSIHREKVSASMLGKRPPYTAGLNILIIGSDSRSGLKGYGHDVLGSRSDTSMLLHIAPGHTRADIISFPRDSMVPVLACSNDGLGHQGQPAQPGVFERLNATFSAGGAPCLWRTLEQTTHIRIQHFVEVNFAGFQSIVNDVGGVPVCLPFAINNAQSRLHLSAGKHVVTGAQALAFVRLREDIGEGSDTQRIQRQQYFLAAVMQKLKATNLLAQPSRIYNVVRDAAKSLTTDSGLDLTTMLRIADSMKSLSSSAVQFITVPVVPYPGDPAAELSWAQPQAQRLFTAIEADRELPRTAKGKKPSATTMPTVSPAKVHVQVLNGAGAQGLASTASTALTSKGFKVIGQGDAANFSYTSNVIEYSSPAQLPEVNTLKSTLGSVAVQQNATLGTGPITLILGSSYTGLQGTSGSHGQKAAAKSLKNLAKNYSGITASANICADSSAFAGPDTPLPGG